MHLVTVDEWHHINAGASVYNGYAVDSYCAAPAAPGHYTLYEVVNDDNTHAGWKWEKEVDA